MAISNPKRTAALSWLSTVTTRPRSMTKTCPLSVYETFLVGQAFYLHQQMLLQSEELAEFGGNFAAHL
jgi:hypothetical protein